MNGDIQNTAELRSQNKKRILIAMREATELTKREISARVSLSLATVSNLANQMEEAGLLVQGSQQTSKGGRIPTSLRLNSGQWYWLAINLVNVGKVRLALISLDMKCVCEWDRPYMEMDYDAMLRCVREGVDDLVQGAGKDFKGVLSAVAAVPAIFDQTTRQVANSTIPVLEGRTLAEDLKNLLDVEVTVENDSNLMALACFDANAGKNMSGLIFVYIGEGLGFGTATRQALSAGYHGFGGEISHIPLGQEGYLCHCGHPNCVETELSVGGFIRKYNDRGTEAIAGELNIEEQWHEFMVRLGRGDPVAKRIVEENAKLLGKLLSVLINLLDPQYVFVGGYVDEISDWMLPVAQDELQRRLIVPRREAIQLQCVHGYNRLITAGCSAMAFSRWNP